MNCIGTYDGTIFYNPANKFCIVSVKTADQSVPAEARSNRRYKDHLIRFTAVGYEIPRTDAVELELDGEWTKGKYGVQLQVEQWREIVPRTKNGVEGYLASGLIKGIGPKTAADIVERFGVDTLDILEHQPERLLEIRGITENKLEDIKASYAENRMLQGIMTLLAPFKITPKTALKIYQYFGPTSVEILEKSPFELCQISGFGFRRVDAIVQKSGGNLHDPTQMFFPISLVMIGSWLIDRESTHDTLKNIMTIPVSMPDVLGAKLFWVGILTVLLGIYSVGVTLITGLAVGLSGLTAEVFFHGGTQIVLAGLTTYMVCMPLILIFGQIRGAYLGGSILAFFLGYSMMFFKGGILASIYPFSAALILVGFDMSEYAGTTTAPNPLLAVIGVGIMVLWAVLLLVMSSNKKEMKARKQTKAKGRGKRAVRRKGR